MKTLGINKQTQTITKVEAAHRQIIEAIRLWFEERDDIAVLTLAASGHQIIHDLNKAAGGEELLFDSPSIKNQFHRDWQHSLKAPWNFFKHADRHTERDPNAKLEFDPTLVIDFILFSTKGLRQLGLEPSQEEIIFHIWLGINRPDWLLSQELFRIKCQLDEQDEIRLRALTRAEFFRWHYISAPLSNL